MTWLAIIIILAGIMYTYLNYYLSTYYKYSTTYIRILIFRISFIVSCVGSHVNKPPPLALNSSITKTSYVYHIAAAPSKGAHRSQPSCLRQSCRCSVCRTPGCWAAARWGPPRPAHWAPGRTSWAKRARSGRSRRPRPRCR